ncbi:MAG: hypothetical protein LBS57_10215 [Treponema sp.]|nr:hypothetical protein [Treponema sp.]
MEQNGLHKWYPSGATAAKFLMGGIGTGNFSVGSRGQLCDWELFNSPGVGNKLPYTFFAIRTEDEQGQIDVRILESRLLPPYERSHGCDSWDNAGIPRFDSAELNGEVSRVTVRLRDDSAPVAVTMTAFTPFIPLDEDNSGIPAAVIRYKAVNTTDCPLRVSVAGSLANAVGFKGYGRFCAMLQDGQPNNSYVEEEGLRGLSMTSDLPGEHVKFGSMFLGTTSPGHVTVKPEWVKSNWWDGAHDFWDDFAHGGTLNMADSRDKQISAVQYDPSRFKIGSLCVDGELDARGELEIEFILSWYFPNRPAGWNGHIFKDAADSRITHNYYAGLFGDAREAARYVTKNIKKLESLSEAFRNALYQTTIPAVMIQAADANITVLRSTTCFRIEDGSLLGWEGSFDNGGSCEGNCSHVWNYQQTLAFLFPRLERSMRRINFLLETADDGNMSYRSNTVFGKERFTKLPPAADGQTGTIIQLYRDWKYSGDDEFLRAMWNKASLALDFAFTRWDTDGDFVFDAEQHNTYDIEFFGITSMINSVFYAALKAGCEMAKYLGDEAHALKYGNALEQGAARMDELLFNGEYYIQLLEDRDTHTYQYYEGCLSDQVLGQQLAHIAGLGYILPKDHIKTSIYSVYKYNFRKTMKHHINVQRTYALNDDGGLICCTWPKSPKPKLPFIYSDEVWTGVEYQVAAHLIYEGFFDEALTIVRAVRDRYDGVKRNPWNEVECGNHYVRSMASWGLLLAASGCRCDMVKRELSFDPKISVDDFTCFFSTPEGWGTYTQRKNSRTGEMEKSVQLLYGSLDGVTLI